MPGYFGFVSTNHKCYSFLPKDKLINEEIKNGNLYLHRHTINKYLNDKIFKETQKYIFILEGFILNLTELKIKYKVDNLESLLEIMYEKNGDTFFNELRGSFSGFVFDKNNEYIILFTDQIGDKQIFYFQRNDDFVFSTKIVDILSFCKELGIEFNLNKDAAYLLLTNSNFFEDITLLHEIKKLPAGTYLKYCKNQIVVNRYHIFVNTPNYNQTENEIIDKIEFLFNKTIKQSLQKNREYGYKNIASLSGGLDSRMTTWIIDEAKNKNEEILNFTYSQSGYLDEIIAKDIANDLKNQFVFKCLDNGLSLTKLEKATEISEGMISYPSLGQLSEISEIINFNKYGFVHTGMIGDVVLGNFYKSNSFNNKLNILSCAESKKFEQKISSIKLKFDYPNEEIFNFYARGFSGANLGAPSIFQLFSESFSPFYDVDFLEYCLSIPLKYRKNHDIYFKWILTKHPLAAKYKWETIDAKINVFRIKIMGKKITLKKLFLKVFRKIGLVKESQKTKKHMNPYDYWYKNNLIVKSFMDNYFSDNINIIKNYDLVKDCKYLYSTGSVKEKCLVLSLLSAIKLFSNKAFIRTE